MASSLRVDRLFESGRMKEEGGGTVLGLRVDRLFESGRITPPTLASLRRCGLTGFSNQVELVDSTVI